MLFILLMFAAIWAVVVGLNVYGTTLSMFHFNSKVPTKNNSENSAQTLPVSILKPLKGVDAGSSENLETFFHLDYPDYELIFSVADAKDPACKLVRSLIARYPNVSAKLIVGDVDVGHNPKINNLVRGYQAAKNDWILISDASVRADRNFLKLMVGHITPDTGVISAATIIQHPEKLGGNLEAAFLSTFYARWIMLASSAGNPTVMGHSMLFRRTSAERFGGIQNLARYLAEDYMTGQAMRHLGLEVKVLTAAVPRVIGANSLKEFWARHVRWGRLRKVHAPIAFAIEPLGTSLVSGLLGAMGCQYFFGVSPLLFLSAHFSLWFICDFLMMARLGCKLNLATPFFWVIREVLAVPLWLHTAAGNTVNWRGSCLKLELGGTLQDAEV